MSDLKTCAECGARFEPGRTWQNFCTQEHQRAFNRLQRERGAILAPLMQIASSARHKPDDLSRFARREATALATKWAKADALVGRDVRIVVEAKMRRGWRAADWA
jgi:hypothetical protein